MGRPPSTVREGITVLAPSVVPVSGVPEGVVALASTTTLVVSASRKRPAVMGELWGLLGLLGLPALLAGVVAAVVPLEALSILVAGQVVLAVTASSSLNTRLGDA